MVCLGIFYQGIKIYCMVSTPHVVTSFAVTLGFIPVTPVLLLLSISYNH